MSVEDLVALWFDMPDSATGEPSVKCTGRWFRHWPTSRAVRVWAARDADGWRPYVELVPARDMRTADDVREGSYVYRSEHAFSTMTGAIWHAMQTWTYGG